MRPLKTSLEFVPKVKPQLKPIKPKPQKVIHLAGQTSIQEKSYPIIIDLNSLNSEDWVGIDEIISFFRDGIQNLLIKRMVQGKLAIEAKLDLHQLTTAEALTQAEAFLHRCQQQGLRSVLIIHGKGKTSHRPVLKNALNLWLRTQLKVLAFHSAQRKDGGTGAVYVLVKKREK